MSWVGDNLLVPGETMRYEVRARGDEVAITSRRLIYVDQGIFGRDVVEINLANVENVQVRQSLMERFLNTGKVFVGSSSGNRDFEINGVPDPMEFRRQGYAAIDDL